MSEREEYTPSMNELVDAYTYCIGPDVRQQRRTEALRAIAAHDHALREQIARDIEHQREVLSESQLRILRHLQPVHSGIVAGYIYAARIARGEGDAHRPERCPTCGCELAYPTAVHVVDCGEGSE